MKKLFIPILVALFFSSEVLAQGIVKGTVTDGDNEKALSGVMITANGVVSKTTTDDSGQFTLENVPVGEQQVVITLKDYETQTFPVTITNGQTLDLGEIFMYKDFNLQDNSIISLTDDELDSDENSADNIAGLLQSSRDVFMRAAAYDFSSTFFRPRGYNSENSKVLINGIEMNKMFNGRPQWGNWGGLNDVQRNQEFSNGLAPSEYTFGGIGGSNNINMRTSELRPGSRITYAASNRSYTGRFMASHSTGMNDKGWAFSVLASRRAGEEGYNAGTLYDSNSFFFGVEKRLNDKHSLNLTAFYAQNRRGKSSANTQEVFDLKGRKYNEYWGYQDGEKRNSRIREIEEPVIMLSHYWDISDKTTLNTNIGYQFGKIGNSRLRSGGAVLTDVNGNQYVAGGTTNPSPAYYQKLPSYQLDRNGPAAAYFALQEFQNNGQLNWENMYAANAVTPNAVYALYEDRNDDKQLSLNTILNSQLTDNITLNAGATYRQLKSENFANMLDLLGGNGYLDADIFSDNITVAQNNLLTPNRIVKEGERFGYNFELDANIIDGFAQAQFKYNKLDFYVAGSLSKTDYQRTGLYQNGRFQDNSLGKSEKLEFNNFGAKGGLTYKLNGRHILDFNGSYRTKAPTIRNSFSNSRENNDVVIGLTDEKIFSLDGSYIIRTPVITARFTGYYTKFEDATEISFYYADGIADTSGENELTNNAAFVQEVLSGIDKRNIGAEVGIEIQATPTIKIKGAAALTDNVYTNNPNLYLSSDDFVENIDFGKSNLKDYHTASGPKQAYSLGFEYRDPDYWNIGITANYFSGAYIDVSPLTRTSNFYTDPIDGLPFNDYDPALARDLLAQEKFDNYTLVNVIGGKSWKVNDYYLGFFATLGNVFDTEYKTGGFEQSRNANFRELRDDKALETPVFGNKYWQGFGRTYFLNLYVRF